MRQYLEQQMIEPNGGRLVEEVTISNKGIVGQLNVGFKYIDSKLNKVETKYIRYHDIGKRKF